MTTLVVLGAGDLGGAIAQQALADAAVRRIVIVDDAGDVARGKALDLHQSTPIMGRDVRVEGTSDLSAAIGAAAVVLASRHGASGEWQGDDALRLLDQVRAFTPDALIVCAGGAQFDVVDRAVLERGYRRARVIGSAVEALRSAAIALAALEAGASPADVSLTVLGRPPAAAFVPWDTASIAGDAATHVLSPPAIMRLDARLGRLWPLGSQTLGAAAARVVGLALTGAPRRPSVYAVPPEESRGIALPVRLGPRGVQQWMMPLLAVRDQVRLDAAKHV